MLDAKKKNLPRLSFSENVNLALVSVAIAFVAWVFAKAGETEQARLTVPVRVTPQDARVDLRVKPEAIPVTLSYPRDSQSYISSENFYFSVDAKDLVDNLGLDWKSKTLALTDEHLEKNIPYPGRVQVRKIGTESKTVEVQMKWDAQPAVVEPAITGQNRLSEGFQLVNPVKITPREVWIAGEEAALAKLKRDEVTGKFVLRTDDIDVSGRTASALETVRIQSPPDVDIVMPRQKTAEVNIEIQEVQTVREIRNVKLDFKAVAPEDVSLEYKEKIATVTVFGPPSLMQHLTPASFEVSLIRPAEEVPGTTKEVQLQAHFSAAVPEEVRNRVTIRSVEPKTIRIRYVAQMTDTQLQ